MTVNAAMHVERVIETAMYFDDLAAARDFYTGLLGVDVLLDSPRLVALNVGGSSVLLLFQRGQSQESQQTPGGLVPGHGAHGAQHLAFAIALDSLDAWLERLRAADIAVESTVEWPRGGRSIYFRDPEGHSVEFLTERSWPID